VKLPEALRELTERLAENAHDVCVRSKYADGWTWGPTVDAAKAILTLGCVLSVPKHGRK
jgi:hypothetical protein